MNDYKPIACSAYEVLERSAIFHTALTIRFRTEHGDMVERNMKIVDVFTKDGAEFLEAVESLTAETFVLRLDSVVQISDCDNTYLTNRC